MKNGLLFYMVYGILNFIVLGISFEYTVKSVIEVDYFGTLLWSLVFATELNDFINKHRNFVRYYPDFEDKWITFL